VRKIAEQFGVDPGTVQRVSACQCSLLEIRALNLARAHSFCGDYQLSLSGRACLQTLKLSLLFRNALVQVLALKLGKLRGEQPGIAFYSAGGSEFSQSGSQSSSSPRRDGQELSFGMGWRVRRQ
jgi:hypothetical protein